MKKSTATIISITYLVVILICAWNIDVSVSTLLMGGTLTNGFYFIDPAKSYHIALYVLILTSLILVFVTHKAQTEKNNGSDNFGTGRCN